MGGKLSPDPGVTEAPETGYPELVQIYVITETGGVIKLDNHGGVLTSRRYIELPISPDDGGKLPLCAPDK